MDSKDTKFNFKLPIEFVNDKYNIDEHIKNDLELNTNTNTNTNNEACLYSKIFNSTTQISKLNLDKLCSFYTTDRDFLKDTQILLKSPIPEPISNKIKIEDVISVWTDISNETGFIEKYQFVDWSQFKFLNNNPHFLQFFSLYNLSTPVISLAMPIFLLIIPFFVIRLQGYKITPSTYVEVLKHILQKHSVGQILFINNVDWDKKFYIIMTFIFYVVQVYYNFQTCYRFIRNFNIIHNKLFIIRDYLQHTLENITIFKKSCLTLSTYKPFINYISDYELILNKMYNQYVAISKYKINFGKIGEIGHIMKCFYQLYNNESIINSFNFSIYFNGFLENLFMLKSRIIDKKINFCQFNNNSNNNNSNKNNNNKIDGHNTNFSDTKDKLSKPILLDKKSNIIKKAYYPSMIDEGYKNCIKNSYSLNKQIVITGPNAAGKTTLLKTTLMNVIFSQQFGCGFYKSATVSIFDFIHCYINIPDTSQRDSLFQAEARRCYDIFHIIYNNQDKNHFCVFDELFSGTNPYEAICSAGAFLKYINSFNVSFVITTHFIDLCKYLNNIKNIKNYQMEIYVNDKQEIEYTYKIIKGISSFKGGISVLKNLNYPSEIIEDAYNIINNLSLSL